MFELAGSERAPPVTISAFSITLRSCPKVLQWAGRENTGDAERSRLLWNVTESHPRCCDARSVFASAVLFFRLALQILWRLVTFKECSDFPIALRQLC